MSTRPRPRRGGSPSIRGGPMRWCLWGHRRSGLQGDLPSAAGPSRAAPVRRPRHRGGHVGLGLGAATGPRPATAWSNTAASTRTPLPGCRRCCATFRRPPLEVFGELVPARSNHLACGSARICGSPWPCGSRRRARTRRRRRRGSCGSSATSVAMRGRATLVRGGRLTTVAGSRVRRQPGRHRGWPLSAASSQLEAGVPDRPKYPEAGWTAKLKACEPRICQQFASNHASRCRILHRVASMRSSWRPALIDGHAWVCAEV